MIWHDMAKSTLLLLALPHLSKNHCCCPLRVRLLENGGEVDFGSQLPPGRKAESLESMASSRRRLRADALLGVCTAPGDIFGSSVCLAAGSSE